MIKDWEYYKNKVNAGIDWLEVIKEAREDGNLTPDYSFYRNPTGNDIPFNLEREYLIKLVENKKYKEAKAYIREMQQTYRLAEQWNFIEIYEYHLHAMIEADKNLILVIEEAKKEFNQHTITIVSVVVGTITLFGTANQVFTVNNFEQGVKTFTAITVAILVLVWVVFCLNNPNSSKTSQ